MIVIGNLGKLKEEYLLNFLKILRLKIPFQIFINYIFISFMFLFIKYNRKNLYVCFFIVKSEWL